MTEHGIDVSGDPQVRIGNLIDAFRAAPVGADLEMIRGTICKEGNPDACSPAIVVTINQLPFPVTLPEAESAADQIDVTLEVQDLPDRESLRQLAQMLRWAVAKSERDEEIANGHRYLN